MQRLGGTVLVFNEAMSSTKKGETLQGKIYDNLSIMSSHLLLTEVSDISF